jgi:hypothetical protein
MGLFNESIDGVVKGWERDSLAKAKQDYTDSLRRIAVETHKNNSVAKYFSSILHDKPQLSTFAEDTSSYGIFALRLFKALSKVCSNVALAYEEKLQLTLDNEKLVKKMVTFDIISPDYKPTEQGIELANNYFKIIHGMTLDQMKDLK